MRCSKNIHVRVRQERSMAADVFFMKDGVKKPIVIYCHGFKGFKDWANFDLIAATFARHGMAFVKFNFSGNGMSVTSTEDFDDLESFGSNNASQELEDLQVMLQWVGNGSDHLPSSEVDASNIYLIGHSRGGGIVLLTGENKDQVKKMVTWASVSNFNHIWRNFTAKEIQQWKESGVAYTLNGRTGQQMPLYYQLYEDYQQHQPGLDILQAVRRIKKPLLFCHGTADEAIPVEEGHLLHANNPSSGLYLIEGANHVFGRKHPWPGTALPAQTKQLVDRTIAFLKNGG